jgi:hypothetical protein
MNRERLQRQIDILRAVAAQALPFDMDAWVGGDGEACGTAACAFGYACLDPAFQAEGLRLMFIRRYSDELEYTPRKRTITTVADYNAIRSVPGTFAPVFAGQHEFSAAATFYDILLDAAEYLFDPGCYRDEDNEMRDGITPDEVIARIERVMDGSFGSLDAFLDLVEEIDEAGVIEP